VIQLVGETLPKDRQFLSELALIKRRSKARSRLRSPFRNSQLLNPDRWGDAYIRDCSHPLVKSPALFCFRIKARQSSLYPRSQYAAISLSTLEIWPSSSEGPDGPSSRNTEHSAIRLNVVKAERARDAPAAEPALQTFLEQVLSSTGTISAAIVLGAADGMRCRAKIGAFRYCLERLVSSDRRSPALK